MKKEGRVKKAVTFLMGVFSLAIIAVFVPVSWGNAATCSDLAGEWWADWSYSQSVGGKFFLEVASVEADGKQALGSYELTGGKASNEKFKGAVVNCNKLKITTRDLYIELDFEGNTMSGFALSGPYREQRSEIRNGRKMK